MVAPGSWAGHPFHIGGEALRDKMRVLLGPRSQVGDNQLTSLLVSTLAFEKLVRERPKLAVPVPLDHLLFQPIQLQPLREAVVVMLQFILGGNALNDGGFQISFSGHGRPGSIAHEWVHCLLLFPLHFNCRSGLFLHSLTSRTSQHKLCGFVTRG